ncbi:hypothetical protein AWB75_03659 [Caballeronia catudaia]|uniref:Uncharacterized protein n=1 Tax=Caballeronia catudaia TaxID=1777136 RepID=A0A158BLP0_9BURK|nr:hypothetical protein AWB75_03659 [Caballeronia catudaia]
MATYIELADIEACNVCGAAVPYFDDRTKSVC